MPQVLPFCPPPQIPHSHIKMMEEKFHKPAALTKSCRRRIVFPAPRAPLLPRRINLTSPITVLSPEQRGDVSSSNHFEILPPLKHPQESAEILLPPHWTAKDIKQVFVLPMGSPSNGDNDSNSESTKHGEGLSSARYLWEQSKRNPRDTYTCTFCRKSFHSRGNLNQHIQRHTGNWSFRCIKCGKGYPRKDRLLRHLKRHRRNAIKKNGNSCWNAQMIANCGFAFQRLEPYVVSVCTPRRHLGSIVGMTKRYRIVRARYVFIVFAIVGSWSLNSTYVFIAKNARARSATESPFEVCC
mmetsp:Transcript_35168/g.65144  ORF Transcript_35168/g.65144 Transcript_35168/m.65144 type:complete len:297 (-) Transcript_35168:1238-2128(-)